MRGIESIVLTTSMNTGQKARVNFDVILIIRRRFFLGTSSGDTYHLIESFYLFLYQITVYSMKPKITNLQICSNLCILISLYIVIAIAGPLVRNPSDSIYNFKKIVPENIFKEQGRERYSTHIQVNLNLSCPSNIT